MNINRFNNNKTENKNKIKNDNKENIDINNTTKNRTDYKTNIIQNAQRKNSSHFKQTNIQKIKYFDESKINNIQIPKDYINIIYYNLLLEEESSPILNLKKSGNHIKDQKEINSKMRSILIDWLIDVHYKFGFTDETLFLTISIIDRYLSLSQISRANFQLLGITALLIACKHEEIDLPKIDDFIYITDNAYIKDQVIKMEYDVLFKLDFSFLYPSPIKFFEYLSIHFNFNKTMHEMGKYLMESFLLDDKNFKYKSSIISCACAYIVMKFFKIKNYYDAYDIKFCNVDIIKGKYNEINIKDCAKDICYLVDNIHKTNFLACFKKYSKKEKEDVANLIMNN